MAKKNKSALDQLLDEITPLEQEITDAKMMLAAHIADAMKAKGWKNKDLLEAVGKDNPSIITKWLSGTHNFTIDTLVELSRALGISLLNLEARSNALEVVYYPLYIESVVPALSNKSYKPMYISQLVSEEVNLLKDPGTKYNNAKA